MALTSAVANAAAAAAAAGAGKKAAQVQLQAELNTDDDWKKFLLRDGLLGKYNPVFIGRQCSDNNISVSFCQHKVVDVYTEWCGPCIGMVGNLKKIKVELGGDNLHLAVAKSDTIECLKRFRKRSEPTWMFIASGQLLNVVFGADAPRLTRTIEQELRNEELAKKGELQRPQRAPHELTPPEQRIAREAAALEEARLARREARATRLETYFADVCPVLMLPHAQKMLRKVSDALEQNGLVVADKCPLLLGKDGAKRLALEDPELNSAAAITVLSERPALTLLLKKMPEKDGSIIELVRTALCGDGEDEEALKKTLYEELKADSVPGLFVPADRHQRAAALDVLFPKMVGAVVEPPAAVEAPHIAVMFGAWQRRAVLAACEPHSSRLLRYGFFADTNLDEPKLLCKTVAQYDERPEKDYCETIVLMIAVGLAEPELADPSDETPAGGWGTPVQLTALGPLHVSTDAVEGRKECSRFFPPGYSEPDKPTKTRSKKKRKKRHETKEGPSESTEAPPLSEVSEHEASEAAPSSDPDPDPDADADPDPDPDDDSEDPTADKATSPPPN
ncbi:unnamed protein product [Diatraea saccharalis]|uniref:Thioredoxin domain-containing protein 6 n=1 Tax=Diatraea saccharalis TaxID=40085 RepID=A0A9N9W753_9NEOP|nr:unnamed protein product [Diatraea saccharalis]